MHKKNKRLALLAVVIAGGFLVAINREAFDAATLKLWVIDSGVAGPALFIMIYALGTVVFLPGSLLTIAGGALFGPTLGTLYNLTGATIGATLAFLIARYLALDWAEQKSGERLTQLKKGVEAEGWRFVVLVRLVPLFPFNMVNYALGLTRINLSHYIIASFVCMLPGAIAYTYLGFVGSEAVTGNESLIQKALLALALLALVAFLPRLIGRLRQKPMMAITELKQLLDSDENILVLDVRTQEDFQDEYGHIPGVVNIPLEELPQRLIELGDYEELPIILVCRRDRRSSQAARLLAREGFADVHVAKGGMTAWQTQKIRIECQEAGAHNENTLNPQ